MYGKTEVKYIERILGKRMKLKNIEINPEDIEAIQNYNNHTKVELKDGKLLKIKDEKKLIFFELMGRTHDIKP
jgi:hypothetical protein